MHSVVQFVEHIFFYFIRKFEWIGIPFDTSSVKLFIIFPSNEILTTAWILLNTGHKCMIFEDNFIYFHGILGNLSMNIDWHDPLTINFNLKNEPQHVTHHMLDNKISLLRN